MKRLLVILALLSVVAAGSAGAAASFSVQGGSLQAGVDASLYCDAEVFVSRWGLHPTTGRVISVTIEDVATACDGNNLSIRLEDGNGNRLARASVGIVSPDTQYIINFPGVDAAHIATLKVWVEGPSGLP